MKRNGWTRNLRLKIGAVLVALVTTLGFYGLIQANPLTHANTPSTSSGSTDTAAPSTDNTAPAFAPAPSTSSSADGSAFAPAAPAPITRRPVTHTRSS